MTPITLYNYWVNTGTYLPSQQIIVNQIDDDNLSLIVHTDLTNQDSTVKVDNHLEYNINFSDLLNSNDCQNGIGIWRLHGFHREKFAKEQIPITTTPLQNELKIYYKDGFKPTTIADMNKPEGMFFRDKHKFGLLFLSKEEKILSLRTYILCQIHSNIRLLKNQDFISANFDLLNGYFPMRSLEEIRSPNMHPTTIPRPFKLTYTGPTEITGNAPINITFNVEFQNLDQKPWCYGDYSKLYADTDKGKIDNSCKIVNNSGSFSFDPSTMNIGDTVNIRIGAHWFYISEVFQITKTA